MKIIDYRTKRYDKEIEQTKKSFLISIIVGVAGFASMLPALALGMQLYYTIPSIVVGTLGSAAVLYNAYIWQDKARKLKKHTKIIEENIEDFKNGGLDIKIEYNSKELQEMKKQAFEKEAAQKMQNYRDREEKARKQPHVEDLEHDNSPM